MSKLIYILFFLPLLNANRTILNKRWLVTKNTFLQPAVPPKFGTRISSISCVANFTSKPEKQQPSILINNEKQILAMLTRSRPSSVTEKDKSLKRFVKKNNKLTNTTYALSGRQSVRKAPRMGFRKPKLERHWEEPSESVRNNLEVAQGNGAKEDQDWNYRGGGSSHQKPYESFPEGELGDCSCFWNADTCGCECQGSLTEKDFEELSKSFQRCLNFTFTLIGGHHPSLPPLLFSKVGRVHNFHLDLSNATFEQIFNPTAPSPFEGVTVGDTATIHLSGVETQRGWSWSPLEGLRGRTWVEVEGCRMERIASDFSKVAGGGVRGLVVRDSDLEMIGSGSFSGFDWLESFQVPKNKLRTIRRDNFPRKPFHLTEIDLRDNQLHSLEGDLFTQMSSLRSISLAGNPLTVFSEHTFSAVIVKLDFQGLSGIVTLPLFANSETAYKRGKQC